MCIKNNSNRIYTLFRIQTRGQARVVGMDRPDAHQNGINCMSKPVNVSARLFPGHPLGITGAGSDAPIQSSGTFQKHKGSLCRNIFNKCFIQLFGRFFTNTCKHLNAMLF